MPFDGFRNSEGGEHLRATAQFVFVIRSPNHISRKTRLYCWSTKSQFLLLTEDLGRACFLQNWVCSPYALTRSGA